MTIALTLERNGSLCPGFMKSGSKVGEILENRPTTDLTTVESDHNPDPLNAPKPSETLFRPIADVEEIKLNGKDKVTIKEGEMEPPKTRKKAGRKSAFTPRLEQQLIRLVAQYGDNDWSTIARHMPQFNRKQLRERYVNFLRKERAGHDFTPEEDEKVLRLVDSLGRKWEEIAKRLPGRTAIMIKNRYATKLKNRKSGDGPVSDSATISQRSEQDSQMMSPVEEAMSDVPAMTKSESIPSGGKRAWDGTLLIVPRKGNGDQMMLDAVEAATRKLKLMSKAMTS